MDDANEVDGPALFPGLEGVAGFRTRISRPDPEGGQLHYRGVVISDLVSRRNFDGVWRWLVAEETDTAPLPAPQVVDPLTPPGRTSQPIQFLQRAVLSHPSDVPLSTADSAVAELGSLTSLLGHAVGLLLRTDARSEQPIPEPGTATAGVTERLVQASGRSYSDIQVRSISRLLATIAEHGTTASTFTCRVVASTRASARACFVAGLSAIGGPRHGGAASQVGIILSEVETRGNASAVVTEWLSAGRRLPGFGHRVYRHTDPRVPLLREMAAELDSPLVTTADAYAKAVGESRSAAGRDPLPANPDLWLPVIMRGLGIPLELGPAVLAVGRSAGWAAHIVEQLSDPKLLRPADLYVGPQKRELAST